MVKDPRVWAVHSRLSPLCDVGYPWHCLRMSCLLLSRKKLAALPNARIACPSHTQGHNACHNNTEDERASIHGELFSSAVCLCSSASYLCFFCLVSIRFPMSIYWVDHFSKGFREEARFQHLVELLLTPIRGFNKGYYQGVKTIYHGTFVNVLYRSHLPRTQPAPIAIQSG